MHVECPFSINFRVPIPSLFVLSVELKYVRIILLKHDSIHLAICTLALTRFMIIGHFFWVEIIVQAGFEKGKIDRSL